MSLQLPNAEKPDLDVHPDAPHPNFRGARQARVHRAPWRNPRAHAPGRRRRSVNRRVAQSFSRRRWGACHIPLPRLPLVLGSDPKAMMAEIFGRTLWVMQGLGGSMHLTDVKRGFLGTSGIVGAGIPHAAGVAWAAADPQEGSMSSCASSVTAPRSRARSTKRSTSPRCGSSRLVFVMENNGYNVVTTSEQEDASAAAGEPLAVKAKAHAMPGVTVDGADPLAVYNTVGKRSTVRAPEEGPRWLNRRSIGYQPTATSLHHPACRCITRSTRPSPCLASAKSTKRLYAVIRPRVPRSPRARRHVVSSTGRRVDQRAAREMDEAVRFALASPSPHSSPVLEYNYAYEETCHGQMPYIAAIDAGIHQEMRATPASCISVRTSPRRKTTSS